MPQESNVSSNQSLTIANLQRAIQQATRAGDWVVAVYPTVLEADHARNVLPALLPDGSSGGGRTTLVPGGGRISVVAADETPFETDVDLTMLFLGWGVASEKQFNGMAAWRSISSKVIGVEEGRAA